MTISIQYICDRCGVAQANDTTLHTMNLSVKTLVNKTLEAAKISDWCDTCLISCGMSFNGKLDMTPVSLMTIGQLASALGQPCVPAVKP